MKDINLIVRHPLLCYDDFLTAVNNEVAALIKLAVFATMHSIILI